MVLALIPTIWTQPDPAAVRDQLDEVAARLEPRFPAVAAMLQEAFRRLPIQSLEEDLVDEPPVSA